MIENKRSNVLNPPISDIFKYLCSQCDSLLERVEHRFITWSWVYYGRAFIYSYILTKEIKYLDTFIKYHIELMKKRHCGFFEHQGYIGITLNGLFILPFCELLFHIKNTQIHYDINPQIIEDVDKIIKYFLDERIETSDEIRWHNTREIETVEPYNHISPFVAALSYYSFYTDNNEFISLFKKVNNHIMKYIHFSSSDLFYWDYKFPPRKKSEFKRGEKFVKAGVTLEMFLAFHRCGYEINSIFLKNFVNLIVKHLRTKKGEWRERIGSNTNKIIKYNENIRIRSITRFMPLIEIESDIFHIILDEVKLKGKSFHSGWFSSTSSIYAFLLSEIYKDQINSGSERNETR